MRRRRLSLLLSALAVLGCSSDKDQLTLPQTDADVVGTYALTSSNGRSLPFTVLLTADEEWDISSDQFVISAGNTWSETTNYQITNISGATRTSSTQASGTYSIAKGQINFTMTSGGTSAFTGSVTGNILSLLFNGGHFLYSK